MILFLKSSDLTAYIVRQKLKNLRIGFVPTMGALHAGHLSLIETARQKCDLVVCSIFVNPTQFNQASDLANYPRTIEKDILLLLEEKCDVLFHPNVQEVYGEHMLKDSSDDYGKFIHLLEGDSRPGHFDGVITILKKLFTFIHPHEVFFGQKDYQQCLVVQTLIRRNFPDIQFNLCPTSREEDGLAMSSRNVRLSAEERKLAARLYRELMQVKNKWNLLEWEQAIIQSRDRLSEAPFQLEYFYVCDPETLIPLTTFQENAIALLAVNLGKTRLIDNMFLSNSQSLEVVNDK